MRKITTLEEQEEIPWLIPVVLGCSCFMILLVELMLSCKNRFITEKNLVLILLSFLLINNILFLVCNYFNIQLYYI